MTYAYRKKTWIRLCFEEATREWRNAGIAGNAAPETLVHKDDGAKAILVFASMVGCGKWEKMANEEKLPIRERELCLKTHFPFDQTHTPLMVEIETTQKRETGEGYVRPRTSRVIFREIKTIRILSPRLHDWAFTFQRRHLHF